MFELSFKPPFVDVAPRKPSEKVRQSSGGTAKIQYWVPKNLPDCKLQKARSLRSDGVERPDFGSESSGDQSFGFWYLLYATSRSFWSKNFDWTVLEAQKELCVWMIPSEIYGFSFAFLVFGTC